jgi:ADP-heptose:LPS heptosyltransferase
MNLWKSNAYRLAVKWMSVMRLGKNADGEDVVLFKPDRIGDFVLATGVIDLFQKEFAGQKLKLVVSELLEDLARHQFPDLEVIAIPRSGDSFGSGLVSNFFVAKRLLRDANPEKLISLRYHPTLYEDLILRGLSRAQSYGSGPTDLGGGHELLRLRKFKPGTAFSYPDQSGLPDWPLELEAHRRLAEVVLNRAVSPGEVTPSMSRFASESNGSLLILPFGSEAIRNYPRALLVEAVRAAGLPEGIEIRLSGERSQSTALDELAGLLSKPAGRRQVHTVYPQSIVGLAEEVAAARCVLTMESAGAHLAAALDKPSVTIIGGGHFGAFGPWQKSKRQKWLFEQKDCFHCNWQCRHPKPICITDIPPQTVAKALNEVWQQA